MRPQNHSVSVGIDLFWRVLRRWPHASSPSLCGKLVYNEETSRVTRIPLPVSGIRGEDGCYFLCRKPATVQETLGGNQQIQKYVQ